MDEWKGGREGRRNGGRKKWKGEKKEGQMNEVRGRR